MPQSIKEIGEKIALAGKLQYRPICVYGTDEVPKGAVQVYSVIRQGHRCLAKTLLKMAMHEEIPPVFIGEGALEGCCVGAASTLGFTTFPKSMRDLMSAESTSGESMFLKASDVVSDETIQNLGKITPLGKYVVMAPCANADDRTHDIKAVLCFGTAEQIRNLCGLIHFSSTDPFGSIVAPWGPHCAVMVSYPAGMTEKAPKNTAFIGPTEPDGNDWFPEELLALSMPIDMARRMSEDYEKSFAAKKPEVTYATEKEKL